VLLALAAPLAAAFRCRGSPLVAGAAGAYAVFVAHAAVDWDWELPAVTLAGLFCGGLLVVAARTDTGVLVLDRRWRTPILGPALALLAVSVVGLVGNRADAAALAAAQRGDWATARTEAERADAWAPWSAEALALEADGAVAQNDRHEARLLLRRAVTRDPTDRGLWARLASVTGGSERQLALQQAARLDPLG
jgi:hypothetical protein